ncbi:hypothetical protein DL93DRAFT_2157487 [Clavulina sp. PMI_390]|nr:hypothetical protein DL93DRAFT_2157487 [Clavulina sp. PMI_390]
MPVSNSKPKLPSDVVLSLLGQCSFREIVKCRGVCRAWRDIIEASTSLRYEVWLGILHMQDGNHSIPPTSSAERLDSLMAQKSAWDMFTPRRRHALVYDDQIGFWPLELTGDVLTIETYSFEGLSGGVANLESYDLSVLPETLVPAKHKRAVQKYAWPASCYPSYFDIENELAILVSDERDSETYDVYLQSLRIPTQNYPLAAMECFDVIELAREHVGGGWSVVEWDSGTCSLIYDTTLLISVGIDHYETISLYLATWDWTTGQVLSTNYFPYTEGRSSPNIMLLSSSSFLAFQYTLSYKDVTGDPIGTIQLWEFSATDMRRVRTFNLPAIPPSAVEINVEASYGARGPLVNLVPPSAKLLPGSKPWRRSEKEGHRLISIHFKCSPASNTMNQHTYELVLFTSTLLAPYESVVVPWERWGPQCACIHNSSFFGGPNWSNSGHRAIWSERAPSFSSPSPDEQSIVLHMIDFNPDAALHAANPESWPRMPSQSYPSQPAATINRKALRGRIPPTSAEEDHFFAGSKDWMGIPALPFVLTTLPCADWCMKMGEVMQNNATINQAFPIPRPKTRVLVDSERVIIDHQLEDRREIEIFTF